MDQGFLLSNGRNGNNSAPNWKLPNCGWCLAVNKAVRKAHCCTRGTCLHHPFPSLMCTNVSSTVATKFKILSDGRLVSVASGKCIGTVSPTPGLTVSTLECDRRGATFIVWRPDEQPPLRAATAAMNLCLGTGIVPGTQKLFHCSGDRCVPGGHSHVSYQDPTCFSQCNASTAHLRGADAQVAHVPPLNAQKLGTEVAESSLHPVMHEGSEKNQ